VFDLSNIAADLQRITDDSRFSAAVAISILAGGIRGFSGFGSALIYVPLISSIYDPKIAAATLLLIDFIGGIPFGIAAIHLCRWREVAPLTFASVLAIPFGTVILLYVEPTRLRWLVAAVALLALAIIASGWRLHDRPKWPLTILVGTVCGFLGSAFQMDGPPAAIYWLGSTTSTAIVRANLMVFIVLNSATIFVWYLLAGLLTPNVLTLAVLFGLPFVLSMKFGAYLFHSAFGRLYRRVVYTVIAAAVIASCPIFDTILR
jgi:uncharacterized protein